MYAVSVASHEVHKLSTFGVVLEELEKGTLKPFVVCTSLVKYETRLLLLFPEVAAVVERSIAPVEAVSN
ncbi:unannotated protein [freshwater metagenome]|uniref:Unannotated protein n=1 Tax=freshwater metagenome TaxID=449393 RepID=A0A6J7BI10_9ZZZZ